MSTYSLKQQAINSDDYYSEVGKLSKEVLEYSRQALGGITASFREWLATAGLEEPQTEDGEYLLELLSLGVLWKTYISGICALRWWPQELFQWLMTLRKRGGNIKAGADKVRGVLTTLFLSPRFHREEDRCFDRHHLHQLIAWLAATGEFDQAVRRFQVWKDYFSTLNSPCLETALKTIFDVGEWFKTVSLETLGKYTVGVDPFLATGHRQHRFKEDVIFCGRHRVEYHLNMVGAEIMNRVFRNQFLQSGEKRVLVPGCMRLRGDGNCRAEPGKNGETCMHCSTGCAIGQIAQLGEEYHFKVVIIAHGSDAFKDEKVAPGEVGIVGVACILQLLEGGWRARNLNFVPQCVVLDYCGCKAHWDMSGRTTALNLNQLKRVLDIPGERP